MVNLTRLSDEERQSKAQLLLSSPGYKVHRHLLTGDCLLVNRQPTLHKPGIMAHRARVLEHVREQTIRMNYPNCNAYNADFDGDEMNCHFVQNQIAKAEAMYICNTDNQYIVPTSGNPLRGLIQDHVASAVKLTCRNTFLTKDEFQQLLYVAVSGLPGTEIVTHLSTMETPPPAILRPREMWTGKQVITALLRHLCRPPLPPLHLDGKARTPPTALGAEQEEHIVIFRYGELLSGVLDKAAIGNSTLGVVHAVYELYGAELAGQLLSAFGRLFTCHLQDAGQSCGIQDLVLTSSVEKERLRLLKKVINDADMGLFSHFGGDKANDRSSTVLSEEDKARCVRSVAAAMSTDRNGSKMKLDGIMQGTINKSASDVIKACLPGGLQLPFLHNQFSMMVLTGAKGSAVNQSQISCFLGQQALEGQRVPIMVSGKSLPSFRAYDASARAMGFVQDRFLTGVRPQEYYFHCMAGREGLVDTAVKTSRSGYLQRCLIKHLEELRVEYDYTVRDSSGSIIQFLYGEDGLDTVSSSLLGGSKEQLLFLARNHQALVHKYALHEGFLSQGLGIRAAEKYKDLLRRVASDISALEEGSVVLARRRRLSDVDWGRNNLSKQWWPAEVVKSRNRKGGSGGYDLKYVSDGAIEKRVPTHCSVTAKSSFGGVPEGITSQSLTNILIKPGKLDPPMAVLKLGSDLGACSEKLQHSIDQYVLRNPDGIISSEPTSSTVTGDALELLVWVKYMRSLACPGEAVGCVAAQSVGEPSTQMTLNTFHLAGHGGANVTLGIPRLREIIMTASKSPKTPTMLLPLCKGRDMSLAKALARHLSRLSLSELLFHDGGVSVGERIVKDSMGWKRQYRVRLLFENPLQIRSMFGVSFSELVEAVHSKVRKRLLELIARERRRIGENSKANALGQFKSKGEKIVRGKVDGDGDEDTADEPKNHPKDSGDTIGALLDGDEDEFEGDSDEEQKEDAGYASSNDDDTSLGNDDGGDSASKGKEVLADGSSESEEEEEDDSGMKTQSTGAKVLSTAVTDTAGAKDTYDEREGWVEISLTLPAVSRRLLMVQLAEEAATRVSIRSTKDISNAYALNCDVNGEDRSGIQTEGVNFEAAWAFEEGLLDFNEVKCNDVYRILHTYGVEAARRSIVSEITAVFGVYGINVNLRHLNLIADFMTRNGEYVPMNRIGMNICSSPLLQMSFETTCTFLTKAAQEGLMDNMDSPSARIVLGKVPRLGTGAFELMVPL